MNAFSGLPTALLELDGDTFVRLKDVGVAMAVLTVEGRLIAATRTATQLLRRFELPYELPSELPGQFAAELAATPLGEAIMWRHPNVERDGVLGCTRYGLGYEHFLLLMREITAQQRALSRRLHRQRLEATGRLVAHIAHDLRAPLSSIFYSADVLAKDCASEELTSIQLAATALRDTIAGLLDFVRLGPPVITTQPLGKLFDRITSLLRPAFRAGNHELAVALHDHSICVRGNSIALEQIFLNLLVNATEARPERVTVRVTSEQAHSGAIGAWRGIEPMVIVRVSDDGPGIPLERRDTVFDEFVTTKPDGTGLGLTIAREAAIALGGGLSLEDTRVGCCFAVALPAVKEGA